MHGVDMREDQDPGAAARCLIANNQIVGKSVPARHALDRDGQFGHIGLHQIDHAIDGSPVTGRAFSFDPAADAFDHRSEVNGLML